MRLSKLCIIAVEGESMIMCNQFFKQIESFVDVEITYLRTINYKKDKDKFIEEMAKRGRK